MLCRIAAAVVACYMVPNAGSHRGQPRWNPDDAMTSFRAYVNNVMQWTIATDLPPHTQASLLTQNLEGTTADMARTLSPDEMFNGGLAN
jgi:Tol biopolymer transport system component